MKKLKIIKSDRTLRRSARADLLSQTLTTAAIAEYKCDPETTALINFQITDDGTLISDANHSNFEPQIGLTPLESFPPINLNFNVGERWLYTSSESDSESDLESSITEGLRKWAVTYRVTLSAVGALLTILKHHIPGLPKDPRTLLRTPTDYSVKCVSGGHYSHVGLANGLSRLVRSTNKSPASLELQINVDGLPLFKSTNTSLWPILCSVININLREPFVVGVFCGKEKPGSATEFMSEFVKEASYLMSNGLTVDDKKYGVSIHSFVLDAPARAFIKGIKSHSGYAACEKCTVRGIYDGKVIFPTDNSPLRTDEAFDKMTDEDHHVEPCSLKLLPIGCVTQFGLDYMHLACLGTMRRLLLYWKGPVGPLHVRLGRKSICDLSKRLLHLSTHVPKDFARRPRTVDEVLRWKATEFREFMLYSGPIVLHGILPDDLYDHFMLLHVAMRLLASRDQHSDCYDYANDLLRKFVHDAEILYGREILVYNVHCLLHLAADVKNLGCLDDFSAFIFENKLGQLKKLIRKPEQPLPQLLRRLHEQDLMDPTSVCTSSIEPVVKSEHMMGPLLPQFIGSRQYSHVNTNRWSLSNKTGNNCILINNGIPAVIKNIVKSQNNIALICSKFEIVEDAFVSPLESRKINIYKVSRETDNFFVFSLADVVHKCVSCPINDDCFVFVPLLH